MPRIIAAYLDKSPTAQKPIKNLKKLKEGLENDYNKMLEEQKKLKNENIEFEIKNKGAKHKSDSLISLNNEIRLKIEDLNNAIDSLSSEKDYLSLTTKNKEFRISNLTAHIETLEQERFRRLDSISNQKDTLELLSKIILEKESKSNELQNKIGSLNDDLEEKIQSIKYKKNEVFFLSFIAILFLLLVAGIYYFFYNEKKNKKRVELYFIELNHRIKNNLQEIISLLGLQLRRINSPEAKSHLNETINRIKAINLINHNLNVRSKLESDSINFKLYVEELLNHHKNNSRELNGEFNFIIEDIKVNALQATHLGLIINELISNWFKYVQSSVASPVLNFTLNRNREFININVKDNGPGIKQTESDLQPDGLGLKLVKQLIIQYKGQYEYKFQNGSEFDIRIQLT